MTIIFYLFLIFIVVYLAVYLAVRDGIASSEIGKLIKSKYIIEEKTPKLSDEEIEKELEKDMR